MKAREKLERKIFNIIWKILCNGCDCENYPECPEGTEGCVVDTLVQSILAKLPKLGFVRLEDVEINEGKIDRILMKYEGADTDEIAHAIASAKGILKRKEGKK